MTDRNRPKEARYRRPSRMPHDLADYYDGVGVYRGNVSPTEFPEHAHPEIEVAVGFEQPSGPAVWQTPTGGSVTHRMREGYVSVLPSGQPHSGVWERDAEVLIFYLKPRFLARAARESVRGDTVELVGAFTTDDSFARNLGFSLRRELLESESAPSRLYVDSVANVLAVHLIRRYSAAAGTSYEPSGGLPASTLGLVTEYVEEYLTRDLTLSEMAGVSGLSPYYFSRLFKRSTGLSPYRYVVSRRVERAKRLLLASDLPIPEVARAAGFADQSHMGRHLKRLLGVTPTSLRR